MTTPTPIYYRNLLDLRPPIGSIKNITGLSSNLQSNLQNVLLNPNNICMSLRRRRVVIYNLATLYERQLALSNETFERAILEQYRLLAISLHVHYDKGIQHYYIRN